MSDLNYEEFQKKQFPEKSTFHRKHLDFFTNLVKWLALRFAYRLYRWNISVNMIDVVGLFLSLTGFIFLATVLSGQKVLPLIGISLICFHIFIDFMDGPIPKAGGTCTKIGEFLDDMGPDIDRMALLTLLGFFTQSSFMVLVNLFVAGVSVLFIPHAYFEMPKKGWLGTFCRTYVHKYSFLSVRVMLGGLPLFLALAIFREWNLPVISRTLSAFYATMAAAWLLLCIPRGVGHNAG